MWTITNSSLYVNDIQIHKSLSTGKKTQIIKYNIHMIKLKVVNPKNSEVVQFFKWFFEEKIKIEDSIVDFFFFKQRLELWAHYWDDTVYV